MISSKAFSRDVLSPGAASASSIFVPTHSRAAVRASPSAGSISTVIFFLPTSACISRISSTISPLTSWASRSASTITSSETSLDPASTIMMASAIPATIRSSRLSSCSAYVGLTTSSSSMRPIRHAPIGSSYGMSEMVRAADAPMIPRMSIGFSISTESALAMIWTSLR